MANNELNTKVVISLDNKQFKAALKDANKESKEFKKQQRDAFSNVGAAAGKGFGAVISAAKGLAPALSAGAVALKTVQTAMRENQSMTDEWARITESAKASWEGFVDSIVTADFGNYLLNMNEMIRQARDAADALDTLGTTQLFTNRAMSEYDLRISQARTIIKNPSSTKEQREAAAQDIRNAQASQLADAQRLSNDYMVAFASKLAEYVTSKGSTATASDYIEQDANGNWQIKAGSLFEKYYGTLTAYEKKAAEYSKEAALRSKVVGTISMGQWGSESIYGKGNLSDEEYAELRAYVEMSDEKLKEVFDLFSAARQNLSRIYKSQNENFEYLNRVEKGAGSGTSGVSRVEYKEGSIGYMEEELAKARQAWTAATLDEERTYHAERMKLLKEELELLKSGKAEIVTQTSLTEDISSPYLEELNAPSAKIEYDPSLRAATEEHRAKKKLGINADGVADDIQTLNSALSSLASTLNFTQGETVRVTQVISRMFSAFGSIVSNTMPGPIGPILSGIGAIVGSFDTGGIIGGTSYKGDKLTAQVSAGEMILNRQQQRNLLDIAQGGSDSIQVTSVAVSGDKLVLAINNSLRSKGRSTIG